MSSSKTHQMFTLNVHSLGHSRGSCSSASKSGPLISSSTTLMQPRGNEPHSFSVTLHISEEKLGDPSSGLFHLLEKSAAVHPDRNEAIHFYGSIHSRSVNCRLILIWIAVGAGVYPSDHRVGDRNPPWTSRQAITGHTCIHTKSTSESPVF